MKELERLVEHAFNSSSECIENRRLATIGELNEICLTKNGNTKKFKFTIKDNKIIFRVGKDEYLSYPFVPYSKADEDYQKAIELTSIDDLTIDELVLENHFSRF